MGFNSVFKGLIGDWVGSRPSLKTLEKRNLLPVLGIGQPVD